MHTVKTKLTVSHQAQLKFRHPDKPIETTSAVVRTLNETEWLAQSKYDGWRLPIYIGYDNNITYYTSKGNNLETVLKLDERIKRQILRLNLPPGTALDTEFVGPRGSLSPSVYILDYLARNGQWLTNVDYEDRWQRCIELEDRFQDPVYLARTEDKNFLDFFNSLKKQWTPGELDLHEGIVLKKRNGKLLLDLNRCKKSQVMFKLKYRNIRTKIF